MPYIPQDNRFVAAGCPMSPGKLNFAITRLVDSFIGDPVNYEALNAAIGALECAKLELYRRVAAPYEDLKLVENGDVYRRRYTGTDEA